MPDEATRRSYTADIVHLDGDQYVVKLYDASFLADTERVRYGCGGPIFGSPPATCHQFLLTGDASALHLRVRGPDDDEFRLWEIWEGLPDGFLLQLVGTAAGSVREGRIEASGTGGLWYGNGLPASTYYGCKVNALRFTFTPR